MVSCEHIGFILHVMRREVRFLKFADIKNRL